MTASTAAADVHRAREMVARALAGEQIAGVERLADGLSNAVYRVTAIGSRESLAVRVFANHHESLAKETAVLDALNGRLPVPERLAIHLADRVLPHACLIYHWIPGITLNKCRQQHAPAALESLGAPIGALLATLARCPLDIFSGDTRQRLQSPYSIAATLGVTFDRLQRDRARSRLGPALADALADRLRRRAIDLAALDSRTVLVHGDVSGRNVLVAPVNGRWDVVALLDWEHAFLGGAVWDIGSLFRYAHRYSERFRSRFEEGYRAAGGALPADWHLVSRLLDATRLVAIFNRAEKLPAVFRESRDLIETLIDEAGSGASAL